MVSYPEFGSPISFFFHSTLLAFPILRWVRFPAFQSCRMLIIPNNDGAFYAFFNLGSFRNFCFFETVTPPSEYSKFAIRNSHFRRAIGDWRLAIGDWRLAIGDWRLA